MYQKIINENQLELLKQINRYLGKRKLPKKALRIVKVILDKELYSMREKDIQKKSAL